MNIERLILGCLINSRDIQDQVIPQLKLCYFYENRQLADLIISMYQKHNPIDIITIAKRLPEEIPISTLTDITRRTVADTLNIMAYVQSLKEDYLKGQLEKLFGIEFRHEDDPFEFLSSKVSQLDMLTKDSAIYEHRDLLDIIEDAEKKESTGLMCSLSDLNKIDPFKPGRLIVLGGRPSHGKTNTSISWMIDFCKQGKKILYFSLEMTDVELVRRMGMSHSYEDISCWPLQIFDRAGVDINYIRSHTKINNPDGIFIDYLGKIRGGVGEKKTYQVEDNVNLLKNLAKECGIPIILLAQSGRDIEKRTVKTYEMSDLADSKGIEAEADLVIFAVRYELWGITEYSSQDMNGKSTKDSILLQVAKNRHGGGQPNIYTSVNNLLLQDFDKIDKEYYVQDRKYIF